MKKNIFILLLCHFIYSQNFSDYPYVGSKSMGMAGAVVSNIEGTETIFYNPAGLANLKPYSVVFGITNLYSLNFLKHQFIGIALPGNMAMSYQQLSTEFPNSNTNLSMEQSISFSQAFYLINDANSTLAIGYNLNSLLFKQGSSAGVSGSGADGLNGSKSTRFAIDVGIHSSLRNMFSFGVFIKNINSPSIGKQSSQTFFPRRADIGITYHPFENLYTTFALQRILGEDNNSFKFGVEYHVTKSFAFRSGIQMNPNRFGCGLLYSWGNNELGYSILTHPVLPRTGTLTLKVNF